MGEVLIMRFLSIDSRASGSMDDHSSSISLTKHGQARIVGVLPHQSVLLPTQTNIDSFRALADFLESQQVPAIREKLERLAEKRRAERHV